MKRRLILSAAASAALFIGALLWFQPTSVPRTTLKLSGPEGLPFKATVKTDGVEVTFSGKLPAELQVTGHSIDCGFQKLQAEGRISLVVAADGETGSAATSSPQGGVRAQIYKKLFVSRFTTTTF